MDNKERSAFPLENPPAYSAYEGLTKREYAAIHILSALIQNPVREGKVQMAIQLTDELFAQLNQNP